jgi:DNA-binding GntR family transcriptional regulator
MVITPRLTVIYRRIVSHYISHGYPPSRKYLAEICGAGLSSIQYDVYRLAALGLVSIENGHVIPVKIKAYLALYHGD